MNFFLQIIVDLHGYFFSIRKPKYLCLMFYTATIWYAIYDIKYLIYLQFVMKMNIKTNKGRAYPMCLEALVASFSKFICMTYTPHFSLPCLNT